MVKSSAPPNKDEAPAKASITRSCPSSSASSRLYVRYVRTKSSLSVINVSKKALQSHCSNVVLTEFWYPITEAAP